MKKNYFLRLLVFISLFFGIESLSFGQNQNYLEFDGSNDYVKYTDDATLGRMDGASNYTIEAWIYPVNGKVAEYDRVLQRYYSFALVMWDGDNNGVVEDWYFYIYDKGSSSWKIYNTQGDATLTPDSWNHIAVVNDATGGTLKLYVNGTDVTTTGGYSNRNMPSSTSSDNLYIGSKGSSSNNFGGYIDEVRLKNTAETPSNLHHHIYDNQYSSDANTAGLFHFNEGSGTSTSNIASGSNATVNGGAIWRAWNYITNHILPLSKNIWDGSSSTDWNNTANWSMNAIPTSESYALIPNVTNQPTIGSSNTGNCDDITIDASATITIDGTLNIGGDFTNNGNFTASGTVVFNGSEEQSIASGIYTIVNVNNDVKSSGALTFAGDLAIASGKYLDCNGAITINNSKIINNNGTLYIGNTFTQNGDYTSSVGLVVFDGSVAQTIPADEYYDLEINNSNGVGIGGDIGVKGNLIISTGTITIDAIETIDCENDATIETDGQITNNGTLKIANDFSITGSGTYTDNGTTEFYDGTNTHNIPAATYNDLIINNTGDTYQSYISGNVAVSGTLTVTKGDLVVGSGETLDCNGPVEIEINGEIDNNGIVNIGSTLLINGNYWYNTGKTVFDGSSAQTIPIESYYNIEIDNSAGVSIAGNVIAKGDLTIINGTFTTGSGYTFDSEGSVIIGAGCTIANNGTLKIANDFTIIGSGTYTDNGTTEFYDGTNTHNIPAATYNNLKINNVSSTYESYLYGDITVEGILEIAKGSLDMNGKAIALGTTGNLNENGGILIGGNGGTITATRTLNNSSSENVGGLGAIITSSANLGATTVIRGHESHENGNSGHTEKSILRYYDITPITNTGLNATLRFSYFASELNSSTEADLALYRSTDGTNWIKQDEGNTTVDASSNYVELIGIDAFSMWTASDKVDYPLPIELLSFTARTASSTIILDWQTASEINNKGFELQRSIDGENWSNIAFINGAGNSNEILKYAFVDNKPNMVNYYRLKQIDFDGAFEYSQMVYAELESNNSISIYPNPANNTLNISGFNRSEIKTITLYNYMGKMIREIPVNTTKVDVSDLSAGYYFIQLQYVNGSYINQEFIKK